MAIRAESVRPGWEDVVARILPRLHREGRCWLWLGSTVGPKGYGQVSVQGRPRLVHRVMYEACVGPIPDGMTVDHTCHRTGCARPEHLLLATWAENSGQANRAKTHCPHGHPYSPANTYRYGTHRACRTCNIRRAREQTVRKRDERRRVGVAR